MEPMGPERPPDYRPTPLYGRLDEKSPKLSDLAPLIGAQAADVFSTEDLLASNHNPWGNKNYAWEANPLPGMNSSMGRLAWGAAETAMIHQLTKKDPKMRKLALTILPLLHNFLTNQNKAQAVSTRRYY